MCLEYLPPKLLPDPHIIVIHVQKRKVLARAGDAHVLGAPPLVGIGAALDLAHPEQFLLHMKDDGPVGV